VPPSLDETSFEHVFEQLAPVPLDQRVIIDARHARWATPYGLTTLLTLAQSRQVQPTFVAPEAEEVASYWARTGFFKYADDLYDIHGHVPRSRGGESDVLLEITPVAKSEDVHTVVERIQEKAQSILQKELNLDAKFTIGFAMTLSEACQNIVEHAGCGGWVAVQTYRWQKRIGRRVAVIAVCDAGIGFRTSLEGGQGRARSDRWDDGMALEDAVIRSVSRFRDPGRGQGLAGIRRFLGRWEGKLTVRSGTARLAITPDWDPDVPLKESLAPFAGAQMQITIPERVVAK
jgi:anti-sigma regulatory factor (Ser/Thr protein kinase)